MVSWIKDFLDTYEAKTGRYGRACSNEVKLRAFMPFLFIDFQVRSVIFQMGIIISQQARYSDIHNNQLVDHLYGQQCGICEQQSAVDRTLCLDSWSHTISMAVCIALFHD